MKLTDFGKELRKIRIDAGHLLKDMAQAVGVTPGFLSAVETGKKPAPPYFITRIAEHYGLARDAVKRLESAIASDRDEFAFMVPVGASAQHREAAVSLARRFPNLDDEQVARIVKLMEEADNE
ncbi:MAG TPA: helix-turn-helix transcriptional regulator [Prosthecobacter sp.]|nr:helix-turn-helix transcriptional regulator [Prosthecobacter sp.]